MKLTPVEKKYKSLGGASGWLGKPLSKESLTPDGIGKYRHFEHGSIHWNPELGAFSTNGGIRWLWEELGWENSFLGYPKSDESDITPKELRLFYPTLKKLMIVGKDKENIGRISVFQNGAIIWLKENRLLIINRLDELVFPELPKNRNETEASLWLDINYSDQDNVVVKKHAGFDKVYPPPSRLRNGSINPGGVYYNWPKPDIRERTNLISEQLLEYLVSPILRTSDQVKTSYMFSHNRSDYLRLLEHLAITLNSMGKTPGYGEPPSIVDNSLFLIMSTYQRRFEEWFLANGFEIPKFDSTLTPERQIWKKGKKAAAVYCMEEHNRNPDTSWIKICQEFLKIWTIDDDPTYTPKELASFIGRLRYDRPKKDDDSK